jgi:hypothetical protein
VWETEDFGTAGEKAANEWLAVIRERYPDENVRIEPVAVGEPTFPLGWEDDEPLSVILRALPTLPSASDIPRL